MGQDQSSVVDAVKTGRLADVRKLVASGADVEGRNQYGWTALHEAAYLGHTQMVLLLLEANAGVNSKDFSDRTPLFMAADNGHSQVAQLLIGWGANVNHQDFQGWTALMMAANRGYKHVVGALYEIGHATVDLKNRDGFSASKLAIQERHRDIFEYLRSCKRGVHVVGAETHNEKRETVTSEGFVVVKPVASRETKDDNALINAANDFVNTQVYHSLSVSSNESIYKSYPATADKKPGLKKKVKSAEVLPLNRMDPPPYFKSQSTGAMAAEFQDPPKLERRESSQIIEALGHEIAKLVNDDTMSITIQPKKGMKHKKMKNCSYVFNFNEISAHASIQNYTGDINIRKATMRKIEKANVRAAKIHEAKFQEAKFQEAKFQEVKFQEAKFQEAKIDNIVQATHLAIGGPIHIHHPSTGQGTQSSSTTASNDSDSDSDSDIDRDSGSGSDSVSNTNVIK